MCICLVSVVDVVSKLVVLIMRLFSIIVGVEKCVISLFVKMLFVDRFIVIGSMIRLVWCVFRCLMFCKCRFSMNNVL